MDAQALAHHEVARALRVGALQRPAACTKCGRMARIEAHHEDYSRPLDVWWLCRSCHRYAHGALRLRTNRKAELARRTQAAKKGARSRDRMITWRVNPEEISTNRVLEIVMKKREQREDSREQKAS